MIMKSFNRRSSNGHHGSKRRELAQHAHSHGSHAFTDTLTSTRLNPLCAKRQLSCYRIWNRFLFDGTKKEANKLAGKQATKERNKKHNHVPKMFLNDSKTFAGFDNDNRLSSDQHLSRPHISHNNERLSFNRQ